MNKIDRYLTTALKQNSSDLHFVSGDPARSRIHGNLTVLAPELLSIETVQEAMSEMLG